MVRRRRSALLVMLLTLGAGCSPDIASPASTPRIAEQSITVERELHKKPHPVISHVFDYDWHDHEISIFSTDEQGKKTNIKTISPDLKMAQKRARGSAISIAVPAGKLLSLDLYDDSSLIRSWNLRDGVPPTSL